MPLAAPRKRCVGRHGSGNARNNCASPGAASNNGNTDCSASPGTRPHQIRPRANHHQRSRCPERGGVRLLQHFGTRSLTIGAAARDTGTCLVFLELLDEVFRQRQLRPKVVRPTANFRFGSKRCIQARSRTTTRLRACSNIALVCAIAYSSRGIASPCSSFSSLNSSARIRGCCARKSAELSLILVHTTAC